MASASSDPLPYSVEFFDTQFRRQSAAGELALNPFEQAALPRLSGAVLDYGCGLGNLACAAAGRGCRVTALDASPAAIGHVRRRAAAERLPVEARLADLRGYRIAEQYDGVASIGLLAFFAPETALRVLQALKAAVRPGGVIALNTLIEGTRFLDMFDPDAYCLFAREEIPAAFAGWETLHLAYEDFPAPRDTVKSFVTLIARRPAGADG